MTRSDVYYLVDQLKRAQADWIEAARTLVLAEKDLREALTERFPLHEDKP